MSTEGTSMEHAANTESDGRAEEAPWKPMPHQLIDWVRQYDGLKQERRALTYRDPMEKRDALDERIYALAYRIQVAGVTASFFGGYDGMKRLHDAAEAVVGRDNSVGANLNRLWDGIGGWWA